MAYRDAHDDELFAFIVGWAETHNIPYELRTVNGRLQVGMSRYHWRRAEYTGVA